MEEVKTFSLSILPTPEQAEAMLETMRQRNTIANEVSQWIFDHDFDLSMSGVHRAMYYDLRDRYTQLHSNYICQTFTDVRGNYKTVKQQLESEPIEYKDTNGQWQVVKDNKRVVYKNLEWLQRPLQYSSLTMRLVRRHCYSIVDAQHVQIHTTAGRITIECQMNNYIRHFFEEDWQLGTATLIYRNHTWQLHIPASRTIVDFNCRYHPFTDTVGIDRGIRFLAVSYDGYKTKFFSGKEICHKREHFVKVRQSLQAKNTKSSRKRLRMIGQRENRYMTDINHCLSKALVDAYHSGTVFVLEDLTGITFKEKNLNCSKKTRRKRRSWAFFQFEQFLSYKAAAKGSIVIKVNRAYTSQRCPNCGIVNKQCRSHGQHEYHCECGFRSNDNRVGAMNIRELGLLWKLGNNNPKIKKNGTLG